MKGSRCKSSMESPRRIPSQLHILPQLGVVARIGLCVTIILLQLFMQASQPALVFGAEVGWSYFLLPEGTVKEYVTYNPLTGTRLGKVIQVYYDIRVDDFGERIVKVREKSYFEGSAAPFTTNRFTYKLDTDRNQVLLIDAFNSMLGTTRDLRVAPEVILSLPLRVGKKWRYRVPVGPMGREILRQYGKGSKFYDFQRIVTRHRKLTVPGGTFSVYVIKIRQKESQEEDFPPGNDVYEYYAPEVGLVAKGAYYKGKWIWHEKLTSLHTPVE